MDALPSGATRRETVDLKLEDLDLADWNPNEQDAQTFNKLVEQMREVGCLEYPVVIPHPRKPGKYLVVSGNHRVKAAGWRGVWGNGPARHRTVRSARKRWRLSSSRCGRSQG